MRLALDEVANIGEGAKSRRAKFGTRAKTPHDPHFAEAFTLAPIFRLP